MPERERVAAFVATVEAGRFVEAIERFYHDDATMQENGELPRGGRDALVAREEAMLAAFQSITTRPGSSVLIDGDRVVVHWTFDFIYPDGSGFALEELAHQVWDGDRIRTERFFYDTRQRRPPTI